MSCSILVRWTSNFRFFITSMRSFWLCGSRVVYPIINRLVPSPSGKQQNNRTFAHSSTLYTRTIKQKLKTESLSKSLTPVGRVRLLRCSYSPLNQFWEKTDCFAVYPPRGSKFQKYEFDKEFDIVVFITLFYTFITYLNLKLSQK